MKREKIDLEYTFRCSHGSLYRAISTSGGLGEWFADQVHNNDDEYTFVWHKTPERALLVGARVGRYARFKWEEDEDTPYYFEMSIDALELTGDLSLRITDFAPPGERDDLVSFWDTHVKALKRSIGCA